VYTANWGRRPVERRVAEASIGAAGAPPSQDGPEALHLTAASWTADIVPHELLESLGVAAAELAGTLSVEHVAAVVATAARGALAADLVLIGTYEEAERHLRVVHETGLPATARQRLPALLAAAAAALRKDGQAEVPSLESVAAALVGHASRDARRRSWDGGRRLHGTRSLAARMPPPERPLGLIFAGRTQGGAFSHGHRAFLNALAAVATLAVERLRPAHDSGEGRSGPQHRHFELRFAGSHVQVGDMQIDLEGQEVVIPGRRVRLTPSELRILLFLATEPGRVRTRRDILRHLWHTDHVGDERACDAHISNLRRKIERDASRPNRVVTVRGAGYALHVPRNGA
jgi:DNA-binding winged helix-turn-helix (wHTH) protein